MNKKITLTLTEKEYQEIIRVAESMSLRPATYCKMIVMEAVKDYGEKFKSRKQ